MDRRRIGRGRAPRARGGDTSTERRLHVPFGVDLQHVLEPIVTHFGYAAVIALVGLECTGLPLPGEIALVSAALYGATTHELSVPWVIVSGACGGIAGGALGFVIGRRGGHRLLLRYGSKVGLDEKRLKVGRYLFDRHGGAIVFVGRFIAILRAYAALLAGVNCMRFWRFFAFYAAGSIVWACAYGFGAWGLGKEFDTVAKPVGIAIAIAAGLAIVAAFVVMKRHESELASKAERAFPGPLEEAATPRGRS